MNSTAMTAALHRLHLCHRVCEGISNEALLRGVVSFDSVSALTKEIDRLRAQVRSLQANNVLATGIFAGVCPSNPQPTPLSTHEQLIAAGGSSPSVHTTQSSESAFGGNGLTQEAWVCPPSLPDLGILDHD